MNPREGGVQKVCDLLARYFIDQGHKVDYLIHEKVGNDTYHYPANIYYLPEGPFLSDANHNYYHSLLEALSIDIVFNHDASNNRSILFLNTGQHKAKKISLYHNDPLIRFKNGSQTNGQQQHLPVFMIRALKLYRKRQELSFLLKGSDKLVFLSQAFIDKIHAQAWIKSGKMLAISNPMKMIDSGKVFNKEKRILFVGRLEIEQKRPERLILLWSKIFKIFPDWELVILGDGPDKAHLEIYANSLQLERISFMGFVDPEPYYEAASIICMTSDYEGFGMVLIEAMQYGVVPITFDNWISLKDIIIDNVTGFLIPPDALEHYAIKLAEIMRNDEVRNSVSANAVRHIQKFDINKIGQEWLNLFDDITTTIK
jgi:glycosyltransferase involved in cell wall biosynthesis